jgi:hypothetical protein
MASISFTDTTGGVTITNGKPSPANRFQGWVPLGTPIGPFVRALGTGIPYRWTFREDHGAKFMLPYIPNSSQSDLHRLRMHLLNGGTITVTTGDEDSATYTCYLWPEGDAEISAPNKETVERTLTLSVLNSEASPMTCVY